MVLPIGFFMPLPLAMMIPFMGIQSAVMAKQFGENFQYGKRRISAMSNEEFNKLTPNDLQIRANAELKAMIPTMEKSVQEMRVFQTFLIREFLRTLNDAIKAGLGELFGIDETTLANIEHTLHGHGAGHDAPPATDTGESTSIIQDEEGNVETIHTPPTGETSTNAFIPPIVKMSDIDSSPVDNAIARIIIVSLDPKTYLAAIQQTPGNWTAFGKNTSRLTLMTKLALAYPSPKYHPSFRNNNTRVYYFRIQ